MNYLMIDGKKIEISYETAKNLKEQFNPVIPAQVAESPHPPHGRRLVLSTKGLAKMEMCANYVSLYWSGGEWKCAGNYNSNPINGYTYLERIF